MPTGTRGAALDNNEDSVNDDCLFFFEKEIDRHKQEFPEAKPSMLGTVNNMSNGRLALTLPSARHTIIYSTLHLFPLICCCKTSNPCVIIGVKLLTTACGLYLFFGIEQTERKHWVKDFDNELWWVNSEYWTSPASCTENITWRCPPFCVHWLGNYCPQPCRLISQSSAAWNGHSSLTNSNTGIKELSCSETTYSF